MPQSGNVDSDTAEGSSDANSYSVFVRNPHPCSHPPPDAYSLVLYYVIL